MKSEYGEKLRSASALFAQAQKTNKLLEEIVASSLSVGELTAKWDLAKDDKGQNLVTLRISDWTGAATTEFAPQEFDLQSALRSHLYHIWGDLLEVRSKKQLEELLRSERS